MKKKSISSLLLFSLLAIFMAGCTRKVPNTDTLAGSGYQEYNDCLNSCKARKTQDSIEYIKCLNDHPEQGPCNSNKPNFEACVKAAAAVDAERKKCSDDYIRELQEISDCETACLKDYNQSHET